MTRRIVSSALIANPSYGERSKEGTSWSAIKSSANIRPYANSIGSSSFIPQLANLITLRTASSTVIGTLLSIITIPFYYPNTR